MSIQATELRRTRRAWAAAGSSHDTLIGVLRVVLPMSIGVLAAFLTLTPLTSRDISFILSKNHVEVATERMRVTAAKYRGTDQKGQPFELDAASAVQQNSRTPIVHLETLNALLYGKEGPAVVKAPKGRYDMDSERIAIDGPVSLVQDPDYKVETRNVLIDMRTRRAVSRGAVDGSTNLGTFRADRLRADLNARTVNLDGRARLHIVQGRSTGAR